MMDICEVNVNLSNYHIEPAMTGVLCAAAPTDSEELWNASIRTCAVAVSTIMQCSTQDSLCPS